MAPKNNSVVKTGLVSFPAGQTKIRRRMRVRLSWKEILNGDLLFSFVLAGEKDRGSHERSWEVQGRIILLRKGSSLERFR